MSRKPVLEGGKRDEIMDAALELFFEKGYDATALNFPKTGVAFSPNFIDKSDINFNLGI